MTEPFKIIGHQMVTPSEVMPPKVATKEKWQTGKPILSMVILGIILLGCLFCELIMTKDPFYLDLGHYNEAPNKDFLFGTDSMGRDIFSMIWYGGRISLVIGSVATVIATTIAIIYGSISGMGPKWIDNPMMRITELLLAIPSLLQVMLLQALIGSKGVFGIAFVIGITSWQSMAKVVRIEVKQLRNSEYVLAAKCMGGKFLYILWHHLAPNFMASIMFMVIMTIRSAMILEATLSFMGLGLPIKVISWGSMLSLADKALLTDSWWIILIPGSFLVTTLICITNIGNYLRKRVSCKASYF